MPEIDDATLMQALRDADPMRGWTLDDHARQRLEQSWREPMAAPAENSPTPRRAPRAHRRTLQSVAAAIVALVILAGGVLVSRILAQRGAGVTDTQPATGGVEGSYRVVRQHGDHTVNTFLVAGGRVLLTPSTAASNFAPSSTWRGFGEATMLRIERVMLDGDQMYLRIGANREKQSRWYRYRGSQPLGVSVMPELALTPPPVFDEDTRGFERVDDQNAQARGLTRYTADADAADLDFLGRYSETSGILGPPVTTVDIWVDADGRVRRLEERRRAEPNQPVITRFDRFHAVGPIDLPYPEGADAPVATEVWGLILYAYGDAAFADELRDRVMAALEGDAGIAQFEILDRSAEDKRMYQPVGDHELFVAALRFTDDVVADPDAQRQTTDRLKSLTAGDVPANVSPGDAPPRGSDPQGYTAIYPGFHQWITLDG